jgi:hypothetical protein
LKSEAFFYYFINIWNANIQSEIDLGIFPSPPYV